MDIKLRKLENLNRSLRSPKELGGRFLPEGFKEQFDFMFVAEMPSMNSPRGVPVNINFNFDVTKRDKFFQEMMIKYNVAGSYVTDMVKERDVPRRPTGEEIKEWLPFLIKEIKTIEPKAIIVLGKRTYEKSFKPYIESKIPGKITVNYVFHYSSQVPKDKFERRFKEIIDRIRL